METALDGFDVHHEVERFDAYEERTSIFADTFAAYQAQVSKTKIMTAEEESAAFEAFIKHNDQKAFAKIVNAYQRWVLKLARRFVWAKLPDMDLVQEGNIGLMKAITEYDPTMKVPFGAYSSIRITEWVANYVINNWHIVRVATTKPQRKIFFNCGRLNQSMTLGEMKPKELAKVAERLNVSVSDVEEMQRRLCAPRLTMTLGGDQDRDDGFDLIHTLSDDGKNDPYQIVLDELNEMRASVGLYKALQHLDERQRDIVTSRWLFSDEKATLEHLSEKYNVSKERIRQIEERSLEIMKQHLPPKF